MRLLQINPVLRATTSTGRIMHEIADMVTASGWESWLAYSKGRDGVPEDKSHLLPVGGRLSVGVHWALTRLFDLHGKGSRIATRRFVRRLRELDPDVIHIHNIHGYFLNYEILFDYLKQSGKPVIWTVHDCWLFTGHCYHYASVGCGKWCSHCSDCPQRTAFPRSWLLDRSYRNFEDKRRAFLSVPDITFVTVSEWMKGEMKKSFLGGCDIRVIHNGIDTDVFSPQPGPDLREHPSIGTRNIILGVASIWSREKGLDDFITLDGRIDRDREVIVLVGITAAQKALLPSGIVAVERTADVRELAACYSEAAALVNPTWQDNYPTVNMEAISCGTPVITYRTGGSVEVIPPETGFVVEQGDVDGLLDRIRAVEAAGKERYAESCRRFALANFGKAENYRKYLELYNQRVDESSSGR